MLSVLLDVSGGAALLPRLPDSGVHQRQEQEVSATLRLQRVGSVLAGSKVSPGSGSVLVSPQTDQGGDGGSGRGSRRRKPDQRRC